MDHIIIHNNSDVHRIFNCTTFHLVVGPTTSGPYPCRMFIGEVRFSILRTQSLRIFNYHGTAGEGGSFFYGVLGAWPPKKNIH